MMLVFSGTGLLLEALLSTSLVWLPAATVRSTYAAKLGLIGDGTLYDTTLFQRSSMAYCWSLRFLLNLGVSRVCF